MTVRLDPGLHYSDARLAALHHWWQAKAAVRGALPGRADFEPLEMRDLLQDLYMVDVLRLPDALRFRYRLIGTAITQRTGRDVTGRFFEDVYPAGLLADFSASFRWIVTQGQPLRSFGNMEFSGQGYLGFEALEVPLATDGNQIDIILGVLALLPTP